MKAPSRLAAALLSAVAVSLALPNELFPLGLPLLGFLGLIPLYLALSASPGYKAAGRILALYGALHHMLSSYWLFFYKDFALWTIGATTLAYALIYYVFGLYFGLFLARSGRWRPLAFALLWTAFEYMKSSGFLGYPWGLLPYTQTKVLILLQVAELTGVYGLGFCIALVNAALAEWSSAPPRPYSRGLKLGWLGFAGVLMTLIAGYGAFRLSSLPSPTTTVPVLIVQQNVDPWREGELPTLLSNLRLSSRALAANEAAGKPKPELLVWSEGSLSRPWEERFLGWFARNPPEIPVLPFLKEAGIPLLTGAPVVLDWKNWEATNSAILISPEGLLLHDYAKTHPVPFAEAIPFWEFPAFRKFMRETVGLEAGWTMGKEISLFTWDSSAGRLRFGTPICFEDAFSELCREMALQGADFLLNITNDAWSRTESAELQHYAAARFRAIELRMPLLRSTNAGLSCLIDARGEVVAELPLFKAEALVVDLPVDRSVGGTVFKAFGEWFALAVVSICALWTAILILEERPKTGRRKAA